MNTIKIQLCNAQGHITRKQETPISHLYLLTTSSTTISLHTERTSITQVGFALIVKALLNVYSNLEVTQH